MGELIDEWENEKLAKVRHKVLRGHESGVNSCTFFNNDSNLVLSGGDDATLRIWDTKYKLEKVKLVGHKDEITCCRLSYDDRQIVSSSLDKCLIVWDVQTNQPILQSSHDGMVMSCDISYDNKYILTCTDIDHAVYLWDLRQQRSVTVMNYHKNTVLSCRFAHHSYRFCTTSMDMTARVVDILDYRDNTDPHQILTLSHHKSMVSACDFSFDERRICTGAWDTKVMIWDVHAGTYRKDGPLVLDKGHNGIISACSFTKSGCALLSSSYEGNLLIWDVDNACKKLSLQGHEGWVTDCKFSKNEDRIISSSKDGTLRYWNVENYESLPVVLANNENEAKRIVVCTNCGKKYNLHPSQNDTRLCVFCRLEEQEPYASDRELTPIVY